MYYKRIIRKVNNLIKSTFDFKSKNHKQRINELITLVKSDQLNKNLLEELAGRYEKIGELISSVAILRSIETLFHNKKSSDLKRLYGKLGMGSYFDSSFSDTFKLEHLTHNTFFRLKTLSNTLQKETNNKSYSVLDVGGGVGLFSLFVPDASYVLAEPSVNGIGGEIMQFDDNSFDFVISSHVLEHIPIEDREVFLDNLIKCSKNRVILLNPFDVENSYPLETLHLLNDLVGASWIDEHIDCILPKVKDLELYASKRGIQIKCTPNGHVGVTVAMVLCDYYARKANKNKELVKINEFLNTKFFHLMDHEKYPNAYMIELIKNHD